MVLITLLGLALLGILATSRHNIEVTLREHAESAMSYSAEAIADNTLRYLSPVERAAELSKELLLNKTLSLAVPEALEMYFMTQLRANPELASIYIGQPSGDFFFVKRQDQGFFAKVIRNSPEREVTYRYYNADSKLIQETLHPEDTFDPRIRPWYQKALQKKDRIWTDPYIFFTSKSPGITVAHPVFIDAELVGVVSVDIEIRGLSAFLATIPISARGAAFIISRQGLAIAFPGLEEVISQNGRESALPQIAVVGNEMIQGLLSQFSDEQLLSLDHRTFKEFYLADQLQYGVVEPFRVADEVWLTGVYAPAEDFQGQIRAQYQKYQMRIIGIWILVCLLAIPVVFGATQPMARIYKQATRDELTQLPNRAEFFRRADMLLQQAQVRNEGIAVAMVDLDGFKHVNDSYGHQAGDSVLAIVGQRLASVVRSGDLVGRLGGDEFALVLTRVNAHEAIQLVERIRKSVSQEPIDNAGQTYTIGATAGVVIHQRGESIQESLLKADQALLNAKAGGKNYTLAFSPYAVP